MNLVKNRKNILNIPVLACLVLSTVLVALLQASPVYAVGYYRTITIDHTEVPSNQTDFPVLVSLSHSTLKTVANGGHVINGNDIHFTDSSDAELNFEIEYYEGDDEILVAWVQTDISSSTDTVIKICYGNANWGENEHPEYVWDDYNGVWHMEAKNATDSSGNGNTGTAMEAGDIDLLKYGGQIGPALEFPGSNDPGSYINCGDDDSLDFEEDGTYTFSAWIYPDTTQDGGSGIIGKKLQETDDVDGKGYEFYMSGSSGYLRFQSTSTNVTDRRVQSTSGLSTGDWTYVTATFNVESVTLFINGASNASGTVYTTDDDSNDLFIGYRRSDSNGSDYGYFDGKLDEIRFSDEIKSPQWIATEYNNQSDPGDIGTAGFYTVGSETAG